MSYHSPSGVAGQQWGGNVAAKENNGAAINSNVPDEYCCWIHFFLRLDNLMHFSG